VRPKLFRDPVHDIIAFDRDDPTEAALLALADAPEMQRLRRVRQLGMTFLVFHGAEHTRFTHSMGVCHLARRIYDQLYPPLRRDPLSRLAVAAAGMLHDVGHGPLSHVLERVSGVHHEDTSRSVITSPESGVQEVLRAVDPGLPARVAALLDKDPVEGALSHIVSSQLDADRLDYILRDGLATGVKIGVYDLARILGMLQVVDGQIAVHERAEEAVEGYLIARFHMYKQVYLHKASRSAERMLEAAFRRARTLLDGGAAFRWRPLAGTALERLVAGPTGSADLAALDDTDVWYTLKRWSEEHDPILAELAAGLVQRQLYKTVEVPADDPRGLDGVVLEAREAAECAGADPTWHVLVDMGRDHGYTPYQPGLRSQPILILNNSGHLQRIEQRSEVVALLGRSAHEVVRLCVPARLKQAVERVVSRAPSLLPR
jgi:HD superfamily phosphohydrolase